jgi:hypothetical protein
MVMERQIPHGRFGKSSLVFPIKILQIPPDHLGNQKVPSGFGSEILLCTALLKNKKRFSITNH